MKKFVLIILGIVFLSVVAAAMLIPANNKAKENSGNLFILPKNAPEIAPGVFYLGKGFDKGRVVEGYAMFVKPGTECGNGVCEPSENKNNCPSDCSDSSGDNEEETSSCYEFLGKDVKWRTIESYLVNPKNSRELDETFVRDNLASNIEKWESVSNNILGNEISGTVDGADTENPDNKNEVMFGDISSEGAIGVTIIWGIFSGPPFNREIVEWDMVFDDTDF